MTTFERLRDRGTEASVAIAGAGLIGRAMIRQINLTPGMRLRLILNRTTANALDALAVNGYDTRHVVTSDEPVVVQRALDDGLTVVCTDPSLLAALHGIDVVVEVTGAVAFGAGVAMHAIEGKSHVIMMNAETDATVGAALKQRALKQGVVYSNSDGDQPGVLKRLIDWVEGIGFEIVAGVNCKGFMDRSATPDTIRPWAEKQNTSLAMTTAFTDGTKMNIENAVLANATGLIPELRGMHGVETDLENALADCLATFSGRGLVDYTLGGDFRGGVFVIGYCNESEIVQPLMSYLKMGDGPNYLFYRPYHLCHMETPLSIAEAILDHKATITPMGRPVAEVVAIAKGDLPAGQTLDGIGGYHCYGEIDTVENARGLLPIGLAAGATLLRSVGRGEPIPLDAVSLQPDQVLLKPRMETDTLIAGSSQKKAAAG